VLGIEDVASYIDFFSPEEWHAIVTGDRSGLPHEGWGQASSSEQISAGVAVYGPDCAAHSDQVAPEDPLADHRASRYLVTIVPPKKCRSNQDCYEIECEACGSVGEANTLEEAEAIARLHQEFVAVLVDRWDAS
jgi:hypothetical protein